jgi:hypothetical protein
MQITSESNTQAWSNDGIAQRRETLYQISSEPHGEPTQLVVDHLLVGRPLTQVGATDSLTDIF